jgi:hypothetical protein
MAKKKAVKKAPKKVRRYTEDEVAELIFDLRTEIQDALDGIDILAGNLGIGPEASKNEQSEE